MLDFITWNLNPEMFSVGPVSIRYYGVLFASSFVVSYIIMKRIFLNEGLSVELLDKLSTYIFVGTVVGARLGHVIFYEPGRYIDNPIEILQIWKGGLASHGAGIGIAISLYFASKKLNKTFLWTADRVAMVVAVSGFFIRMGNLMNSEIYGITTSLPWGFIFENNNEILPKHPTQLYEGGIALILFGVLFYGYFKTKMYSKSGLALGIFLVTIFTDRFLIEFIKQVQSAFEKNMILNMGQLLSIPAVLIGVYLIYNALSSKAEA